MKAKFVVIFSILILVPIALIIWIGSDLSRSEYERSQQQTKQAYLHQLEGIDAQIQNLIKEHEIQLINLGNNISLDIDSIRQTLRKTRAVSQIFILDPEGKLVYPRSGIALSKKEQAFLQRTDSLWKDKERFFKTGETERASPQYGWHTWFWGPGVNFIFWKHLPDNRILGFEIDRAVLMSDLISVLPDTLQQNNHQSMIQIRLLDASSQTIYQWGSYQPATENVAFVRSNLQSPLKMWGLELYLDHERTGIKTDWFWGISFLVISGALFVFLAFYFYRENTKEIRDAMQKVTFVNQVSHELKTPLTNIRLYAELLENRLDPESKESGFLGVIVSESQRLSRLISNILSFAGKQNNGIKLRKVSGIPDEKIQKTLDQFQPVLESKGIETEFQAVAADEVFFDPDVLDQILGNLLNNIEKYAADGGLARLQSRLNGDFLEILISDEGPGIPASKQNVIFEPFTRLSNQLTDGVSGTGLGLTISRELARKHGGDLTLEVTDKGACFKLVLNVDKG